MSKTVLSKSNKGHITHISVVDDGNAKEINRLCNQGCRVQATGKDENYTVKDGWLEYNTNDILHIALI